MGARYGVALARVAFPYSIGVKPARRASCVRVRPGRVWPRRGERRRIIFIRRQVLLAKSHLFSLASFWGPMETTVTDGRAA